MIALSWVRVMRGVVLLSLQANQVVKKASPKGTSLLICMTDTHLSFSFISRQMSIRVGRWQWLLYSRRA